jgi:hypothetical protein
MEAGADAAGLKTPAVIAETKDPLTVLGQTMGSRPTKSEDVEAHPYEIAYRTAPRQRTDY